MKKITLYLLILMQLMAMVSIARGEEGPAPYEEIILPMPEGFSLNSMGLEPDGAILVLAQEDEAKYSFLRWRAFDEMPEVIPLPDLGLLLSSMEVAPDGAVLLRSYGEIPAEDAEAESEADAEAESESETESESASVNMRNIFVWLDESLREVEQFEIEADEDTYFNAKALPGKRLVLSDWQSGELKICDATGEIIQKIDSTNNDQIVADATTLYAFGYGEIFRWSLSTFEKLPTQPVEWQYFSEIFVGPDGSLYMKDESGIQELDLEAGKVIRRMSSMGLTMGDPDFYTSSICALPDGAFAMVLWKGTINDEGEYVSEQSVAVCQPLKEYTKRTSFVITRMYDWSPSLEKAAFLFQRAHPELAVEFRTLNDYQTGGMMLDDALRMINTELLAGGGGDILLVDELPVQSMIKRGVLRDLSHLVPDLGLLPGIAEGSKHTDGKVYTIPTDFNIQLLWGRAEAIETINGFTDILNAPLGPDQTRLSFYMRDYHLRNYFTACMRDFLDADGYFDPTSENFITFLETVYALYSEMDDSLNADMADVFEAERIALRNGNIALYPERCNSFYGLSENYSFFGESEARVILLPSMHAPGNTYQPQTLLSIPASAKNPELSEEFIRLVFGDDTPSRFRFINFSTMEAKLDQTFADVLEDSKDKTKYKVTVVESDGSQFTYNMPDEPFLSDLRALLNEVSVPDALDETILGFIMEEVGPFFEGRITAEETGEAIKQRAWLYMHE